MRSSSFFFSCVILQRFIIKYRAGPSRVYRYITCLSWTPCIQSPCCVHISTPRRLWPKASFFWRSRVSECAVTSLTFKIHPISVHRYYQINQLKKVTDKKVIKISTITCMGIRDVKLNTFKTFLVYSLFFYVWISNYDQKQKTSKNMHPLCVLLGPP